MLKINIYYFIFNFFNKKKHVNLIDLNIICAVVFFSINTNRLIIKKIVLFCY